MKVIVAKTAGFCNGVRYALDMTLDAVKRRKIGEKICTYGPLIHNHQVLAMLKEKGVEEVKKPEDCKDKTVIIRAHGIPPDVRHKLYEMGARVINATCKRVAQVQAVIRQHARKGFHTVIVGDEDHAEVIGLKGYADGKGIAVQKPEDIDKLPDTWDKVLLVAQTTQNEEIFEKVVNRFLAKYPRGVVKKTICGATRERQDEVKQLARKVDAMVIVGGYHSGNTVRLAQVAAFEGIPTYHVETEKDLNPQEMQQYKTVGVSAGASTPQWMIENVVRFLEGISYEPSLKNKLRELVKILVYSQAITFISSFFSVYAVGLFIGVRPTFSSSLVSAALIFSMQVLMKYFIFRDFFINDPTWRAFTIKHKKILLCLAIVFPALTTALIWEHPSLVFGFIIAILILMLSAICSVESRDFSKFNALIQALYWTEVITIIPYGNLVLSKPVEFCLVFLVSLVLFTIKTALQEIVEVKSDNFIGKKTILDLWGNEQTKKNLTIALLTLLLAVFLGPAINFFSKTAYGFTVIIVTLALALHYAYKKGFREYFVIDAFIEGNFILIGLIGFICL